MRHIAFDLNLVGPEDSPELEDILHLIVETSQDLVDFMIFLPYGLVDFPSIYRRIQTIHLPKCKRAEFEMLEDFEDHEPGAACDAFAVFMQLLDAPVLKTIDLSFTSPFSHYIPTLTRTIQAGGLPMLQRLEGRFQADGHKETGPEVWSDSIRAHRKTGLEAICKARGIDLGELR